mgnify:CR=1 FL=1
MKILFFRESEVKNLNPEIIKTQGFGATETSFILLAERLGKTHDVKVCCPCSQHRYYNHVEYIPLNSYIQVITILNIFQPDVFIVVGNPQILFEHHFHAKKIVFWQQNHPFEMVRYPIQTLLQRSIKIVLPSIEAADYAKEYYGSSDLIYGIYNGVREEFFITRDKVPNKIVYSGSLTRVKGVLELLKIHGQLNYDITICGSFAMYGYEDEEYKTICTQILNNDTDIKFLGSLGPTKLAEELASAELCVVNPIIGNNETCCVSALESMAAKTCVIAGGNSVIDPIILKGGVAYKHNLADQIDELMSNVAKRNELALNGYNWVKNLMYNSIAKQWDGILND